MTKMVIETLKKQEKNKSTFIKYEELLDIKIRI